jgi:hypothetical protein
MIIFDLDDCLADCEHRRHFVTEPPMWQANEGIHDPMLHNVNCDKWRSFKPDWQAFYEACDKDKLIWPVKSMLVQNSHREIQIWSGRCESVRKKTICWLYDHTEFCETFLDSILKMRPIGDYTPDDQLKERWLDEALAEGKTIDFVFDDRKKVVEMWRRRGIFVFDVNQKGKEF